MGEQAVLMSKRIYNHVESTFNFLEEQANTLNIVYNFVAQFSLSQRWTTPVKVVNQQERQKINHSVTFFTRTEPSKRPHTNTTKRP